MFQKAPVRADELPLFASPCTTATVRPSGGRDRSGGALLLWIGLPVVVGSLLLFAPRANNAQDRPTTASPSQPAPAPGSSLAGGGTDATRTADDPTSSGRRPLSFYTGGVRSNLFSPPQPKKPKPPKPPKPVVVHKPTPPPPPPPVNPFADWSYTGSVTMGEKRMALLENTKTKDGEYVKAGDSFQGGQVVAVTDQMVTLTMGGRQSMLAMSDKLELTPLQGAPAAAPAGGPPSGAPPPPAPNMPPPGMMQMPTQGMITLPNGVMLTPGQATRRARRLNRNFDR